MTAEGLGPLAVALAKAQAAFPAISRDKEVNTGSYKFKYAPLESIIAATRGPLGDNGLAVSQLVDEDVLVTMLLHESGAVLSARTTIPAVKDIQALGSAITYLRRYALTSILGISAEDDDDGNRGKGNPLDVKPGVEKGSDGSLIGTAEVGDRSTSDYSLRNTPDGPVLGFRLRGEKGGILVRTRGQLARDLDTLRAEVIGHRVTCWGRITTESFTPAKKGAREVSYQVLDADRVQIPGLPPLPTALTEPAQPEAESEPLGFLGFLGFDELEALEASGINPRSMGIGDR